MRRNFLYNYLSVSLKVIHVVLSIFQWLLSIIWFIVLNVNTMNVRRNIPDLKWTLHYYIRTMRIRLFYYIIICILILTNASFSHGQWTKIRGIVTDAVTKEPLPFVNISFPGTNIGCITDFNGEYYIETRMPGDSLMASYVGYHVSVSPVKKHV